MTVASCCRDDLERTCAEYERDPAPILRHDPNISEHFTSALAAPSGLSYKDKAELYRIQTEEAWGRWLWLVAELIPNGERPTSGFRTVASSWFASNAPHFGLYQQYAHTSW